MKQPHDRLIETCRHHDLLVAPLYLTCSPALTDLLFRLYRKLYAGRFEIGQLQRYVYDGQSTRARFARSLFLIALTTNVHKPGQPVAPAHTSQWPERKQAIVSVQGVLLVRSTRIHMLSALRCCCVCGSHPTRSCLYFLFFCRYSSSVCSALLKYSIAHQWRAVGIGVLERARCASASELHVF